MKPTGEKFDPFDPPPSDNREEMSRLVRALQQTDRCAVFIVTCNRADLRDQLIAQVRTEMPTSRFDEIVVTRKIANLLPYLADLPVGDDALDAVFVYGLENFLPDTDGVASSPFVANLNGARDAFPLYVTCPIVLWLPDYVRNGVMRGAPDFYSVRSASFVFHSQQPTMSQINTVATNSLFDVGETLLPEERRQREGDLRNLLSQAESLPDSQQDYLLQATLLDRLGGLYIISGDFVSAEPVLRKALSIREANLGVGIPETANGLNNLALLLQNQGKLLEAEQYFRKSLEIQVQILGDNHSFTASILDNLAILLHHQGKLVEAERLYRRALSARENLFGANHSNIAGSLNNLASLYRSQGYFDKAAQCFETALGLKSNAQGPDDLSIAAILANYAALLQRQGKLEQAETIYTKSLRIYVSVLGDEHPRIANLLMNFATLLSCQGKIIYAEQTLRKALEINEHILGSEHPETKRIADMYAYFIDRYFRLNLAEQFASKKAEFGTLKPMAALTAKQKRKRAKR